MWGDEQKEQVSRLARSERCKRETGNDRVQHLRVGLAAEASASETIAGSSISACSVTGQALLSTCDLCLQRTTNPFVRPLPAVFRPTIAHLIDQKLTFAIYGDGRRKSFWQG
jgi:hypothetical protein